MADIKFELLKVGDQAGLTAALAAYWKSFLGFHGIDLSVCRTDAELMQRIKQTVPPAQLGYLEIQFQQCLGRGHVIVAKNVQGQVVGVANYIRARSVEMDIRDNRSEHVAVITNFKVTEHKGDVTTAKQLLVTLLDVIDQQGIPRIMYGMSYDDPPDAICIDHLFGPGKMGFEPHDSAKFRRPDGQMIVAGLNGAYMALQTIRSGKHRPPALQL